MKKFVSVVLSCTFALGAIMGFAACGGDEGESGGSGTPHTHTYAATWSYDKQSHWHAATCDDAEGDAEFKDKAAHGTPGADGKCPTCGYQIKGTMTFDQFKAAEGSAEKIRDYARSNVLGFTSAEKEFVWGTGDSNNKLSSLTYLYFDATGKAGIWSLRETDLDVTFDALAAGTAASASGGFGGTGGIVTYDLTAQAGKEELGTAAFNAYKENHPETTYEPAYTAPLMRLVKQGFSSSEGITNVYFLDIFQTGFVQYRLVVTTGEEQTDEQLIALLQDGTNITRYVASSTYATRGELLYSKM